MIEQLLTLNHDIFAPSILILVALLSVIVSLAVALSIYTIKQWQARKHSCAWCRRDDSLGDICLTHAWMLRRQAGRRRARRHAMRRLHHKKQTTLAA